MVSGKTSKAVRKSRPTVVVQRSTPWGLIAAVVVVALFAGVVFGYAFMRNQENQAQADAMAPFTPTAERQDPSTQIPGVQVQPYEGSLHVDRATQVAYTRQPPMGGAHDFSWAACNGVVYPEAIRSENAVHSMEHGAVWIAYNPDQVKDAQLDKLRSKVEGQPYLMLSPYPGLDRPIALQSWGHQLKVDNADDGRIDNFIKSLRQNQFQNPEPHGRCDVSDPTAFNVATPPPFVAEQPGPDAVTMDGKGAINESGAENGAVPPPGVVPPTGAELPPAGVQPPPTQ
jgi:Protein of unknown function (DUF3105)